MFGDVPVMDETPKNEIDKSEGESSSASTVILAPTTEPKQEPEFFNSSYDSLPGFDQMETSPIPFTTPYKVRDPIILLERCDKIWETLKLIKDVQNKPAEDNNNENTSNTATTQNEENASMKYITYQPVLNNGNSSLPNFKLAVKSMKKLFHCHICGKEYSENRSLRHHSLKIHGYVIPLQRQKKIHKEPAPVVQNSERSRRASTSAQNGNVEQKYHVDNLVKTETVKKQRTSFTNVNNGAHPQSSKNRKKDTKQIQVSKSQEIKSEYKSVEPQNQVVVNKTARRQHRKVSKTYDDKYIVCTLCKRRVACIKTHLKDYHKVSCRNVMLNELKNIIQNEKAPEKKSRIQDLYDSLVQKVIPKKATVVETNTQQNVPNKRKRKYRLTYQDYRKRHKPNDNNSSETNKKYKCDVCKGIYLHYSSFTKHKRKHVLRGETKSNFDRSNCRYKNSPFLKLNNNNNNTQDEVKNKQVQEKKLNNSTDNAYKEFMKLFDGNTKQLVAKCDCGRTFRNPHTLYVHKSNCKFSVTDGTDTDSITRNSSDRDSGIGISITIKKKNDSYEVVSKEGEEAKSKDSENTVTGNCTAVQNNDAVIDAESTKYSKDHSILKLEIIDEDIDVDIEGDFQNDTTRKNGNSVDIKNIANKYLEEIPNDGSLKMNDLCRIILNQQNVSFSPARSAKSSGLIACTCGRRFKNVKNLNIHASKTHPLLLMCGYCNENINGIGQYNKHRCNIEEGGKLTRPEMNVRCPICKVTCRTSRLYDNHVKTQHPDSSLPYQCYKCKSRYPDQTSRHVHFNQKHGVVPCSICDKKIHISMKWTHEAYHFGLGFPCHICKKAYPEKFHFMKHYHTVHTKQQNAAVTCTLCWKPFKRKTFIRHIYEHRDSEICRLCKSVFTNVEFLQKHVLSEHYDTYPMIKCDFCDKFFLNKTILNMHLVKDECLKKNKKQSMESEPIKDS